jgi:acetyltransferase-like isoleucine patch superfamily enzyme
MDHCTISRGANLFGDVYVCEHACVGPHAQLSPGVILFNDRYPPMALKMERPVIGDCAVVGVQSVIWPGVEVGQHAVVASLSEVKEDVPEFALVRGVPAKTICDVRQIRMKIDGQWVHPYPWVEHLTE